MQRLLVVEDYPPLAKVISIAMSRRGFVVERVGSARRALATGGYFDVAILDIDLPDATGLEVAEQLIAEQRVGRLVFYTSTRRAELRDRATLLGTVIDKQRSLDDLLQVVSDVAESASSEAQVVGGGPRPGAPGTYSSGTRRRLRD